MIFPRRIVDKSLSLSYTQIVQNVHAVHSTQKKPVQNASTDIKESLHGSRTAH